MTDLWQRDPDEVLAELQGLRRADAPTHGGRVLAYVYDSGIHQLDQLAGAAAAAAQPVNGLDPTVFTSVAALERSIVTTARRVLAGNDPQVAGTVTSGGTESCLLAVKTARDTWQARVAGTAAADRRPALLIGSTAHPAFRKAAHYLGLELRVLPVDPATCTLPTATVEHALADDVALVVASAPSYAHGVIDPIGQIAEVCARAGVALHVDACIGGWVLPWWPDPRADRGRWDLTVPGVTSLSVDLHKYGYAPKGVSVLLHSTRAAHRRQYFATTRWPGYAVVNPTALGSRSVMPVAAAWAVLEALGDKGFARLAADCATATTRLRAEIELIDGLRVVGDPCGPLLAVAADASLEPVRRVDPHRWADACRERGWVLQPQPGLGQDDGTRLPRTTHLTVTPVTLAVLDALVTALREAADVVRGLAPEQPDPTLLAAAGTVDCATLDPAAARRLLTAAGLTPGGALPERSAPLLALIEALPPGLSEALLVEYLASLLD